MGIRWPLLPLSIVLACATQGRLGPVRLLTLPSPNAPYHAGNLKTLSNNLISPVIERKRGSLRQPSFPKWWSTVRDDFALRGYLGLSGDVCGCHHRGKVLLVFRRWMPGVLLNILQCTGQPQTKNFQTKMSRGPRLRKSDLGELSSS